MRKRERAGCHGHYDRRRTATSALPRPSSLVSSCDLPCADSFLAPFCASSAPVVQRPGDPLCGSLRPELDGPGPHNFSLLQNPRAKEVEESAPCEVDVTAEFHNLFLKKGALREIRARHVGEGVSALSVPACVPCTPCVPCVPCGPCVPCAPVVACTPCVKIPTCQPVHFNENDGFKKNDQHSMSTEKVIHDDACVCENMANGDDQHCMHTEKVIFEDACACENMANCDDQHCMHTEEVIFEDTCVCENFVIFDEQHCMRTDEVIFADEL